MDRNKDRPEDWPPQRAGHSDDEIDFARTRQIMSDLATPRADKLTQADLDARINARESAPMPFGSSESPDVEPYKPEKTASIWLSWALAGLAVVGIVVASAVAVAHAMGWLPQ